MSKLTIWLTPLWVLSIGVAIGLAALAVLWCLAWLVNRRFAKDCAVALRESALMPAIYLGLGMTVFAVAAMPVMPWSDVVASLKRLPYVNSASYTVRVEPKIEDQAIAVNLRADELQGYSIESKQDVAVNIEQGKGFIEPLIQVLGDERYQWAPGAPVERKFDGEIGTLYVTNESDSPTDVTLNFAVDVATPEVRYIPITAYTTVGLALLYLLVRWVSPQTSVIAAATAKETVSQPVYLLLMAVGAVALFSYVYIPYNTFGEDVKMFKTSGMTTIKVLAIIVALWTASTSVADEIEGRTALTVLSKPVGRRQFVVGKFLGIVWPILLMFLVLGVFFLFRVSLKVVYDARESAKTTPIWQECFAEVVRIVPGLILAFFESVIMAAISVAASTRLQMLPNLIVCGSIYVLGHLATLLVQSSIAQIALVRFVGRLISVFLPVLDHFEIEGAIAGATAAPPSYLLWTLLYTVLYCTAAMLLALIFFEDRDLA
ncbi:MAG: ABC transporter permease subunit [Planctomycetales bacterium]|nr:ABC transporter permease subunit [Planctomycetales bacterium]